MLKFMVDEHQGWSIIKPGLDEVYMEANNLKLPEEGALVEGVGIAYTDEMEMLSWQGGKSLDLDGIQWVYAFKPKAQEMLVYQVTYTGQVVYTGKEGRESERLPNLVAEVDLMGPEPNWGEIECGAHLERCRHAVYVHAEQFGIDSKHPSASLSVQQFFGKEELREQDAVGAIYKGKRYTFLRSGRREADGEFYDDASVDGKKSKLNRRAAGVKLIYPKLRSDLLRSGELKLGTQVEKTDAVVEL